MTSAGQRLRTLIEAPDIVVMPGVHDTLAALVAERAGAKALLHSSAGTDLDGGSPGARPVLARVVDHITLSGRTPLTGLGPSRLGPLFPDQTRVHDPGLGAVPEQLAR